MNRSVVFLSALALCIPVVLGCSSAGSPLSPGPGLSPASPRASTASDTVLWGYFDVYVDVEDGTIEAVANRHGMFTANVVNFLNSNPLSMKFKINEIVSTADYIDVDINVGITHPFPGMQQYDGYDVRGVFMGDGSAILESTGVSYALSGTDQSMLDDPDSGGSDMPGGGPDGYTRWFNLGEFQGPGMPLFKYTPGNLASNGFAGTATLNPYKYFSDGLDTFEDVWSWLNSNADQHGVFSSGAMNERNYYLRFPTGKGVKYGYAVIANWTGSEPEYHPSNAAEAVSCKVDDNSTVYYVDPSNKGGDLLLDISLFGWMYQPSTIIVESTVLSSPHELSGSEMIPVGGTENYSTYHVEIPADDIVGSEGNEYWIIARFDGFDYSNDFGVMNDAWDDPLAAYFRFNLAVSPSQVNQDPICDLVIDPSTPVPATDLSPVPIMFDASGSSDPDGDSISFEWDFNGDGTYDGADDTYVGSPDKPTHGYVDDYTGKAYVRVTDGKGGDAVCSVDVDVTAYPSKNLPLRSGVDAWDLAFEGGDGDLTILYSDDYVYKYLPSEYYQTGHSFYQKLWNQWHAPQFHESNQDGFTANGGYVTVSTPPWDAPQVFYYKPNAASPYDYVSLWSMQFMEPMPTNIYFDVFSLGPDTGYPKDMGGVYGYDDAGLHWVRVFRHKYNGVGYFDFMGWCTASFSGSVYTGYDKLYWQYIKAVETEKTGINIWFLENTDFYASRWTISDSNLVYGSAYFGTGSATDSDNGWNDGRDITRDNQNRFFVLDKLSTGGPRIKMWSVSGNTTTSEGGFGDSTSISGNPLRIEGGDFSGRIFVLHGDTTNGFFLSIFSPIEMPS